MSRVGRRPRGLTIPPVDHSPQLLALWEHALTAPRGIKIESEKRDYLRTMLHKVRRELSNGEYAGLRITYDKTHLWIVPRDP